MFGIVRPKQFRLEDRMTLKFAEFAYAAGKGASREIVFSDGKRVDGIEGNTVARLRVLEQMAADGWTLESFSIVPALQVGLVYASWVYLFSQTVEE